MANQIDAAGTTAGKSIIRMPLMMAPLATETIKEVVGFINA